MDEKKISQVLNENLTRLQKKPNYLSSRADQTKIVKNQDTGKPCVTIYVSEKVDRSLLSNKDAIPKKIDGVLTDVIELKSDDFELGTTDIGNKPPEIQKQMMGVRKD